MKITTVGLANGDFLKVDKDSFKQVSYPREYLEFSSIVRNGEVIFEPIPYKEDILYYIFTSGGEKWEVKEDNVVALIFEKEEVLEI